MRLIDADDLLAKVQENAPGFMDSGSTITKAFIMAMINTKSVAPTIDAVPIVRCKDCKYRSFYCTEATDGTTMYECHYPCANSVPRPFDWYCADGKRRDDNA